MTSVPGWDPCGVKLHPSIGPVFLLCQSAHTGLRLMEFG